MTLINSLLWPISSPLTSNSYNDILDRSLLNTFKDVVSTYHMEIKFSVIGQVGTVERNLIWSQTYYLWVVKNIQEETLQSHNQRECLSIKDIIKEVRVREVGESSRIFRLKYIILL